MNTLEATGAKQEHDFSSRMWPEKMAGIDYFSYQPEKMGGGGGDCTDRKIPERGSDDNGGGRRKSEEPRGEARFGSGGPMGRTGATAISNGEA